MTYISSPSSRFDPKGREKYVPILQAAGYVEDPQAAQALKILLDNMAFPEGYWCYNCQYFRLIEPKSPTNSWCEKLAAPDRPHGCCDYHERREA